MSRRSLDSSRRAFLTGVAATGALSTVGGIPALAQQPITIERGKPLVLAETILFEVLKKYQGVFIGEQHVERHPARRFLIDQIPLLAAVGVRILGLEAFYAEDQVFIDEYMLSPNDERKRTLQERCKWADDTEWLEIVDKARQVGIRVIGIDTALRRNINHQLTKKEVNMRWAQAISRAQQKAESNPRYIVFGGLHHSRTGNEYPNEQGVNQILNIPSIVPASTNDFPNTYFGLIGGYTVIDEQEKEYAAVVVESFEGFCTDRISFYKSKADVTRSTDFERIQQSVAKLINRTLGSDERKSSIELINNLLRDVNDSYERDGLEQLLGVFK